MATFEVTYKDVSTKDTIEAEGVTQSGDSYRFYAAKETVALIPVREVRKVQRLED